MCKIKVAYIGNCGEEFSGILQYCHSNYGTKIVCVCDDNVKRGLDCVEKYMCSFVEDYHVIMKEPEINLVIIESCGVLRRDVILDVIRTGKVIYVILDEKTLMEIDTIKDEICAAQQEHGKVAAFVTVDELDNDLFANLPVTREALGKLLNVTISVTGGDRDTVQVQRSAYDSVRRLYDLFGEPESMVSASNKNQAKDAGGNATYSGDAVFRFPSGVIAHIMVGGPYHEEQICVYGTQGMVFIKDSEIYYHLTESGQREGTIPAQKRRTRSIYQQVEKSIKDGIWVSEHSIAEAVCMAKMLRCVLDL